MKEVGRAHRQPRRTGRKTTAHTEVYGLDQERHLMAMDRGSVECLQYVEKTVHYGAYLEAL